VAAIFDVEEPYRDLAARVPESVREDLTPLELRLRVTEAFQIIADDDLSNEVKRDREKARASRLLKACAPSGYAGVMNLLEAQIREAELNGDQRRAYELRSQASEFIFNNPQPSLETMLSAAKAQVSRLRIPPPMPSNKSAITRRFGKKSRKR
jgi:hypothetical protein